jgi:hypothetical protein
MYEKAGRVEKAQNLYLQLANEYEKEGQFEFAARMYKKASRVEDVRRLYRQEAKEYETEDCFVSASEMYKDAGDKEMSLFMRYISLLDIDRESKKLLQEHKHVEALQSLFEKELISEEVFNVFMFDGKSPVSFVRDRRRFGRGQSAQRVRNRASFARDKFERGAAALSSDPSSMKKDSGSSKEPEDEE